MPFEMAWSRRRHRCIFFTHHRADKEYCTFRGEYYDYPAVDKWLQQQGIKEIDEGLQEGVGQLASGAA